jgi:hypothetical protein
VLMLCAPAAGLRHDTATTQLFKGERKHVEAHTGDR